MASLGADDSEAVDGFHGSDKTYARIIVRLVRADAMLAEYVAVDELERALGVSRDRFRLFDAPKASAP